MSSNIHLKEKAIFLRKKGRSYSQILKELNLKSKGTLSAWFKDIQLDKKEQNLLQKNQDLAVKRGLKKFNSDRSKRILNENEFERIEGKNKIENISNKELLLIGACLYWGEGSKSEKKPNSHAISFANSDPNMIRVFLKFIREIWNTKEEKIRAGIHIYSNISPDEAKKYWSKITMLPSDRFYIVNQVSRASQGKRPYNSLPYGTAVIRINSRKLFFRMKGLIQGIIDKLSTS